jgi:hypothetical protein
MYKYISVILSNENHEEEINSYALKGWRLVAIVLKGWDTIVYFEKPL